MINHKENWIFSSFFFLFWDCSPFFHCHHLTTYLHATILICFWSTFMYKSCTVSIEYRGHVFSNVGSIFSYYRVLLFKQNLYRICCEFYYPFFRFLIFSLEYATVAEKKDEKKLNQFVFFGFHFGINVRKRHHVIQVPKGHIQWCEIIYK